MRKWWEMARRTEIISSNQIIDSFHLAISYQSLVFVQPTNTLSVSITMQQDRSSARSIGYCIGANALGIVSQLRIKLAYVCRFTAKYMYAVLGSCLSVFAHK
jgi:hypothetical protein